LSERRRRLARASTVALGAVLLAYANVDAWQAMRQAAPLASRVNLRHLSVLLVTLLWARAEHLPAQELGLHRAGLGRSLVWGAVIGTAASVPIRLFFLFPLVMNRAVTQPELHGLRPGHLLALLTGQFLLSTAVFEEVAFRGVLHAKLVRLVGVKRALLIGSGLFSAWHAVITWHNLRESNLPRRLFAPLYGAAMVVLFGAGLLFGGLRQGTGHLAGSILAHWLMVSTIVLSVARVRWRT
jgi:membrane protease YdiL (CAAX protease family)